MSDGAQAKAPKGRSPSYPGVSLDVAIQKAEKLFDAQRDHLSRPDVVLGHMGYSRKSGAGLVTLAALKKFGLLKDEGTGQARRVGLSDAGLRIVRDKRPGSPERADALKRAALTPPVHNEVWERYHGSLPDDDALTFYLEMERSFTPGGAKDFVSQFRRTIAYAQLAPSDSVGDTDGDNEDLGDGEDQPDPKRKRRRVTPPADAQTIVLPLTQGAFATVEAVFPLSEAAWDQMIKVLEVMKPGLVADEEGPYQDKLPEN